MRWTCRRRSPSVPESAAPHTLSCCCCQRERARRRRKLKLSKVRVVDSFSDPTHTPWVRPRHNYRSAEMLVARCLLAARCWLAARSWLAQSCKFPTRLARPAGATRSATRLHAPGNDVRVTMLLLTARCPHAARSLLAQAIGPTRRRASSRRCWPLLRI